MGKRRITDDGGVSLFPFLSILACLIGILTLMISVMTQLNTPDSSGHTEEEIARAKERRRLVNEARKLETEIQQLDQRINKERASAAQLTNIRDEKRELEKKAAELTKTRQSLPADPDQIANQLRQQINDFQRKNEELQKEAKEIQTAITRRKQAPDPAKSIQVRPGGTGWNQPTSIYFVECTEAGINIMNPGGQKTSVKIQEIPNSPAYRKFLDSIKKKHGAMVLYLIRTTGYQSYRWAAFEAREKSNLRTGKLPLPHDGTIDLSSFK